MDPLDRLGLTQALSRVLVQHPDVLDVGTPEPGRIEVRTSEGVFDVWVRQKDRKRGRGRRR